MPDPRPLRTFGRIKGRPLRQGRADLVESLLPRLALELSSGRLESAEIMPGASATWLEIGFGGGEHLAAQAAANPDVLFLGAEPFLNGVASAVRHVEEAGLANVRLHAGDARDVMAALPDASVDRIFVLFPDPWPKTRHQKRRLVREETVTEFARILRPGGRFRFATDWADYAERALEAMLRSGAFDWPATRADDWRRPPEDHVTTRYEQKRLGDCAPVFLDFIRR